MTALRMALSELRRLTAGRLPKLAVIALLIVPVLYGGLYLYANHNPYGRLDKVPTAVVVEDEGTTLSDGEKLDVGTQVAGELVKSKSFDWHEVDRTTATKGVSDGTYEFAVVLPKTFSADLASSAEFTPKQANLELITNDANNYIAHTMANQVVAQVTKTVASEVSETAASKLLAGYSTIHTQVSEAATGAAQLQSGLTTAASGAAKLQTGATQLNTAQKQLSAGATKLATGASKLDTGLSTLQQKTRTLPKQTKALASGADQVADGNEKIATTGRQVATASSTLVKDLSTLDGDLATRLKAQGFTQPQINQVLAETAKLRAPVVTANTKIQSTSKQLNQLATGARKVSNGAAALAKATPALTSGISTAASGANQLNTGAQQLAAGEKQAVTGQGQLLTGVTSLNTGITKLKTGATDLHTGLENGVKQIPNPSASQRKAVAETLGAPVTLQNVSQATADSYGAGLAPFFLSLACWIGAYVLFLLVRPLSPRALAALQSPLRVALGGWLPPALFGAIQATLLFTAVSLGLGINAAHPWPTVGFLILTSLTFVAILHALSAWFGAIGKFLGLVLMVIQLVSAGGTFPWQTIPAPLYFFHHVLPMSYAIDGVRHLMYGGSGTSLGRDLLVLGTWLLAALAASTMAARKQRVWSVKKLQPEIAL
ncbi:putative membrane protein [Kribbella antiqua]|uniref:Putative membrane protein n=1 Tax=Kribbella antiqua TaxID=2512217 RepID=A0A4R2IM01_9ACTN|nr:YhgE/Pip domain-containing protein [Kribbella antiqua]TCO46073.1 putative membrane protein [Kribbella antiqua]